MFAKRQLNSSLAILGFTSFVKNVLRNSAYLLTLLWRHSGPDSVSNHQPHECLLNRPSRHRSKKTSKLRVTGLCAGNSSETGEFPAQMASNAENVPIWWRHHESNHFDPPLSIHPSIICLHDAWVQKSILSISRWMVYELCIAMFFSSACSHCFFYYRLSCFVNMVRW